MSFVYLPVSYKLYSPNRSYVRDCGRNEKEILTSVSINTIGKESRIISSVCTADEGKSNLSYWNFLLHPAFAVMNLGPIEVNSEPFFGAEI